MSSASTDRPAERSTAPGSTVADPPGSVVVGASAGEPLDRSWEQPVWAATHPDGRSLSQVETGGADRPSQPSGPSAWRWVVVAVVVAGLGLLAMVVIVEVWGRGYVADQVEAQLRAGGITGDIEVSLAGGWRPVVLPAVAGRGLGELHIRISDGSIAGMPVATADYVLRDIDGSVSLRTGEVQVRSIGSGRVRIEIAVDDIADAVGTGLDVGDGRLVTADGVGVDVTVDGESLVLGGPAAAVWGAPIELPVVDGYLLPCTPRVAFRPHALVLSCTGSRLPGVLGDPLAVPVDPDNAPVGSLVPPQSTIVRDEPTSSTTEAPTTAAPTVLPPVVPAPVPVVPPAPVVVPAAPPAVVPPPIPPAG